MHEIFFRINTPQFKALLEIVVENMYGWMTYLVALYNGHPGTAQHNNNVKMAKPTRMAKPTSNQNSILFSAL